MKYYGTSYFNTLKHSGTKRNLNGTSVSDEKGTDNKANNTSAYNHDYYIHHKDKWGVKTSEYTDGDSEMDDKYYSEENRIPGTNFFAYKDKNGNWIILEEDMKWKLPAGENLTSDLKKKLMEIGNQRFNSAKDFQQAVENAINTGSSDFDVDAAALDVIRGKYGNGQARKDALGDDYEKVQRRVNEMLLGNSGDASESKEESKEKDTSSSSSKSSNTWYTRHERKIEEKKEKSANK